MSNPSSNPSPLDDEADDRATKASAESFPASDAPGSWASEPGVDPVPSTSPGLAPARTERTINAAPEEQAPTDTSSEDETPDPAEIEPTDNSSGAPPDLHQVEEHSRDASDIEHHR